MVSLLLKIVWDGYSHSIDLTSPRFQPKHLCVVTLDLTKENFGTNVWVYLPFPANVL